MLFTAMVDEIDWRKKCNMYASPSPAELTEAVIVGQQELGSFLEMQKSYLQYLGMLPFIAVT